MSNLEDAQLYFLYSYPGGEPQTSTYVSNTGAIRFDPSVCEQRYMNTLHILEDTNWKLKIRKVVDFGCSEMRFLMLLRRCKEVEHILAVDTDEITLSSFQCRAEPNLGDYVGRRERPLRIELLKGSIDASVENVRNVDAVVAIEIIEHLYSDVLDKVPANIFGFMQPKLAIFTTPNSDYNVVFNINSANGFRHPDHKFEWSRAEFREWAFTICRRYPNYKVNIKGAGAPPENFGDIGPCTQIAIFARLDMIGMPLAEPLKPNLLADWNPAVQYKPIRVIDYPYDNRTQDDKILDEARYRIENYRIPKYYKKKTQTFEIPLAALLEFTAPLGATKQNLKVILENFQFHIKNDKVILPEFDQQDYDDYIDSEADAQGASKNSFVPEELWE